MATCCTSVRTTCARASRRACCSASTRAEPQTRSAALKHRQWRPLLSQARVPCSAMQSSRQGTHRSCRRCPYADANTDADAGPPGSCVDDTGEAGSRPCGRCCWRRCCCWWRAAATTRSSTPTSARSTGGSSPKKKRSARSRSRRNEGSQKQRKVADAAATARAQEQAARLKAELDAPEQRAEASRAGRLRRGPELGLSQDVLNTIRTLMAQQDGSIIRPWLTTFRRPARPGAPPSMPRRATSPSTSRAAGSAITGVQSSMARSTRTSIRPSRFARPPALP